jgi:arrestin-2
MKKLGPNAYPFTFTFPPNSPCSVTLQPGDDDTAKPLGVEYNVKTYVAESPEEKSHKRSSVSLTIKKVHFPQTNRGNTIILRLKQVKLSL